MPIFYAMLNVSAINARAILLSSKEPPAQIKTQRSFLKSLGLDLIEDYKKIRSQQTIFPQNLKVKLVYDEDSEPSAQKAKSIYKICAECEPFIFFFCFMFCVDYYSRK